MRLTASFNTTIIAVVLAGTLPCYGQTPCPPATLSVDGGASVQTPCTPPTQGTLSSQYPGDVGIANDPDVVWAENFEKSSVAAVTALYSETVNAAGMSLSSDKPPKSSGGLSMRMLAGSGTSTTHLFKNLANSSGGYDQWFVRWYAKYQGNVPWHHTGMWIGGYNPATNWPAPRAGQKPVGNDRFSFGFEPLGSGSNVRLDFYNYWMNMHSSGGSTYYGNSILRDPSVQALDNQWICIEMQIKLNTDMSSSAGSELAIWINDTLKQRYTPTSPRGYWIADRFCPENTTDTACTSQRTSSTPLAPLNLQVRTTNALKLNHIWMQNFLDGGGSGSVWFDDVVVAKRRVGCIQ